MKNDKVKSFWVRSLSGVVLLVAVLLSLLSASSFVGLVCVIGVGASLEFVRIAKHTGVNPHKIFATTAVVFSIIVNALVAMNGLPVLLLSVLLIFFLAPFIIEIYRVSENPLGNLAATFMTMVYVGVPMSLFMWIGLWGGEFHPELIIAYISMVWANDIGAYLVGMTIGRRRLFERLSPKKSWEGFFGGVIVTIVVSVVISDMVDLPISLVEWIIMGALIALSSVYGDLIESLMKRSVNVKDSGSIMPGHGGFLDRFDSMLYSIPVVFLYLLYIMC